MTERNDDSGAFDPAIGRPAVTDCPPVPRP
jgi:hypothetical protein